MPRETAAVSAHVLCTPNNHAPVYTVTSFKATHTQSACVFSSKLLLALLTVWPGSFTCSLDNTGVERIRKQNQHGKLTTEKKRNILPPLLQRLEPATFRSRVRRSVTELSSLPSAICAFSSSPPPPPSSSSSCRNRSVQTWIQMKMYSVKFRKRPGHGRRILLFT